ncbi:MAG: cystathionine beta-lyase/cystathionine gamma-synthase [Spirochaetes bacterium]|nr:cystathionine beta-lyase/cystathionine gamma-synthase [Spirochaetota bacterium]
MSEYDRAENICAHFGEEAHRYANAVVPPLFQNSLFTGFGNDYSYTRGGNPTIEIAEAKLAALERAERALCFSSGMAAITSAILSCVESGDHIVAMRSVYGGTRQFFKDYLPKFGVETTFISGDSAEEFVAAAGKSTRVFYFESPSTFIFKVIDVQAVTALARERGVTTILDNSWATPLFQRPATRGVDLVVHSASKYLGGHSDIVAGVVAGSRERVEPMILRERGLLGGAMDPHQAWLLTRGLRTLPVRMRRHEASGFRVARAMQDHPRVRRVLHPGLESSPYYERASAQLDGFSGLFSIVVDASDEAVRRGLDHLQVFRYGPSWGGFESLVVSAELEVPAGMVRISVGLEDPEWLIEDLGRFLDNMEA